MLTAAGAKAVRFGPSPVQLGFRQIILLHPDLPQPLDGRNLTQPRGCGIGIDGRKQLVTIGADPLGQSLALLLTFRQAVLINSRPVTLDPFDTYLRLQPFRRHDRQRVQCLAQGRPDLLQAIEHPNGSQHMS